ncbi:hypothetical protein GF402_04280 [Candidatus Fermentibacteria bacterium]|nr:hypothetical protein [Candidatus Fermentibacteria bacterium]
MTGLATRCNNYLYVSSRAQNCTYRYTAPGISSRYHWTSFTYASETRDIAVTDQGYVWVATDWTSIPLRLYNINDQMVDQIGSALIPYARGVTIDSEEYLWVGDHQNDKIYKVDLTEAVEDDELAPVEGTSLSASCNPFSESVCITARGFGANSTVRIYSLSGALVHEGPFDGQLVFSSRSTDQPIFTGTYMVVVSNPSGARSSLKLLKI